MATKTKSKKKSSSEKSSEKKSDHQRATEERSASGEIASRFDAFRELAQRRAEGQMVLLPRNLPPEERRLHVRQTLREDHRQRIHQTRSADAKFEKLAGSVFSFFRGTCLLFYRDMAGEDAWMPTVLTLGDVHPENFGVMPSSDNTPIFGVNDFDEAYYAPFTWDIKRGAVGFMLAAREEGVHHKKQIRIIERFVSGYLDAIAGFADDGNEVELQVRLDNAPPLIQDLLKDSQEDREDWLEEYLDSKRQRFEASEEIVPVSSRVDDFQEIIDRYKKENDLDPPERAGKLKVKDVARKKGSGTASLGLPRYFVLMEGPSENGRDDLILELKQARRSALAGLAPQSQYQEHGEADRVVNAQAVHLVGGDPFYGHATIDDQSFLVRERSPFKNDIDPEDLSKKEWRSYAEICGRSLAQAHALADDSGAVEQDIEPLILEAVGARELFTADICRFADNAIERIYQDHEFFVADHELGAFRTIDRAYE
ncbi:MAG: DUF2252 domain-containing protein [Fuerstiella sp.]